MAMKHAMFPATAGAAATQTDNDQST